MSEKIWSDDAWEDYLFQPFKIHIFRKADSHLFSKHSAQGAARYLKSVRNLSLAQIRIPVMDFQICQNFL